MTKSHGQYDIDHPEVRKETARFAAHVERMGLFDQFENAPRSEILAHGLGAWWYRFSSFMSQLPAGAVARLSSSEMRHVVIQTAYEELGETDPSAVHVDLFRSALLNAGFREDHLLSWAGHPALHRELQRLESEVLERAASDQQLLGLLHGLELPANEIVEHLFHGLSYKPAVERALDNSKFFELHRVVEDEHIRRGTANYLLFCPTFSDKVKFQVGVDWALDWWRRFWNSIPDAVHTAA